MRNGRARLTPFLVGSLLLLAATVRAETFVSDFETSFDGWQQQWQKDSPTGTDGVATHSTERGYQDGASLKFDMGDGLGDDGTLWIEKQFAVSATLPTHVSLEFQLFSQEQSDFNNFGVGAVISSDNPDEQVDFTGIGVTDAVAGWAPFAYESTLTSPSGQAWVALGIRVAWETHRDYWIDHVVVSTTVIPEPLSAALTSLVGGALLLRSRLRFQMNGCSRSHGSFPGRLS